MFYVATCKAESIFYLCISSLDFWNIPEMFKALLVGLCNTVLLFRNANFGIMCKAFKATYASAASLIHYYIFLQLFSSLGKISSCAKKNPVRT